MGTMKLITYLLLLTLTACYTIDDCPTDLPRDKFLKLHETTCYYFLMHSSYDHTTAQQSCRNIGGRLAVIRDSRTQDFLQATMRDEYYHKGPVWIGLTNTGVTEYTWGTGAKAQYTNWAPSQPPADANGCVAMETNRGGVWMAFPCHLDTFADIEYPFVCEFPLTSECRQCGDINNRRPCNELDLIFAPYTRCPTDTPFCMNDIYQSGNQREVYKRCVDFDTCYNLWYVQTSPNRQCTNYNVNSHTGNLECHLCCYGDHCNSQLVPPNPTLYQPDNPTTTTKPAIIATTRRILPTTTTTTTTRTTQPITTTTKLPTTTHFTSTTTTKAPSTTTPGDQCPKLQCSLDCGLAGYQVDAQGCPLCACDV